MNLFSRVEAPFLLGATLSYLGATLLLWTQLFLWPQEARANARREPGEWGRMALWGGATLQLVALAGQGPALFGMKAGVVGLFGWFLIVSHLIVGRKMGAGTSAIVAPLALLAALYSLAAPQLHLYVPAGRLDTVWLAAHVFFFLLGYVALAFAFAASLLYLVQEGLLKRKRLSGLWQKLPSLSAADEWIYRATLFGLGLLSLALVLSIAFSGLHDLRYAPLRDPKVLFSGATWAIFALYVLTRARLGWHGRRSNLVVIYGFVVMAISIFGVRHLVPVP